MGLSHGAYLLWTLAVPLLLAALLEAGIAAISDFVSRRRLVVAGQCGLLIALLVLGWTRSGWGLALGLTLAGTASGVACGAAQALLVTGHPRGADRAMLVWTTFAAVGDLLTPIVTAGAIALGLSYRGAMVAIAAVVAVQIAGLLRSEPRPPAPEPLGDVGEEDAPAEPLGVALRRAIRLPRLWAWLLAAASCTLLDEIVVALCALRTTQDLRASESWGAVAAVAFAGGGIAGAMLAERLVARRGSRTLLVASSGICAVAMLLAVATSSPLTLALAMLVAGAGCAPHHALAQAQAYQVLPRNPGTVQATAQLLVVVDIVAPVAVGLVADRFGLRWALASLVLQPVVIAGCALALLEPRSGEAAAPHQRHELGATPPSHEDQRGEEHEGNGRAGVQDEQMRCERADHDAAEEHRAGPDHPRQDQEHGAEDLEAAGHVAEPLPRPDDVEEPDHGRRARHLVAPGHEEHERERDLDEPERDLQGLGVPDDRGSGGGAHG